MSYLAGLQMLCAQVQDCGPPLPPCEDERQATINALGLHSYSIEAPPDAEIESILKLITGIFQVKLIQSGVNAGGGDLGCAHDRLHGFISKLRRQAQDVWDEVHRWYM
jgi:hypothetical protein